jgi:hypothetical protein
MTVILRNATVEQPGSGSAKGSTSHAEGRSTVAGGLASHAEGQGSAANGAASHAEGQNTTASSSYAHAEGSGSTASGPSSHAEGAGTTATNTGGHAEGTNATATGDSAHAEGYGTNANGTYTNASGAYSTANAYSELARSSVYPQGMSCARAQYSEYTVGATCAAANGTTAELTYGNNGVNTTATNSSVLLVPFKSALFINYSIAYRPVGSSYAGGFAGNALVSRGGSGSLAMLVPTAASVGSPISANATYTSISPTLSNFATADGSCRLQIGLVNNVNGSETDCYVSFRFVNQSGLATYIFGTLTVQTLITNVA